MSPANPSTLRLERRGLGLAAAFGLVGAAVACLTPAWISLAYRLAVFACLTPSIGCLVLVLIHRITGGQWAADLAPFLRAGASLLPWIWLFAFPLLVLSPALGGPTHAARASWAYDGVPMVAVRAVVYAGLFFGLRWATADGMGLERQPARNPRPWVGPVGLIVLFFLLTLLADDWLESLEPGWHSTAFPVVWIAGGVVFALALALLAGLWSGARPEVEGGARRALGLDWGNLLLASMVFWAYVSFAQFLIIWAGNLPEETSWYLRREHGLWKCLVPAVAIFGFALPFFLLLSRRLKTTASGLAWVSALLVASQLVYTAWVILPAGGRPSVGALVLAGSFLAGGAGIYGSRGLRAARLLTEAAS
jgi:hypothetical protein